MSVCYNTVLGKIPLKYEHSFNLIELITVIPLHMKIQVANFQR